MQWRSRTLQAFWVPQGPIRDWSSGVRDWWSRRASIAESTLRMPSRVKSGLRAAKPLRMASATVVRSGEPGGSSGRSERRPRSRM